MPTESASFVTKTSWTVVSTFLFFSFWKLTGQVLRFRFYETVFVVLGHQHAGRRSFGNDG